MSHPERPRDGTASRAFDQSGLGTLLRFGLSLRLALIAALGIVAAACSAAGGAATANSEAATEAALLAFAQCMRDQGIDDMPDPTVDSQGNVRIQRPPGDLHDDPAQHERFEAARDACAKYLEGVTQGFSHADDTEAQDKFLQLAQCLRGRGVDVPDPDFSGGGHDPFGDSLDRSDPSVQEALRACQQEVFGSEGVGHG
jgi:hypothetical protein